MADDDMPPPIEDDLSGLPPPIENLSIEEASETTAVTGTSSNIDKGGNKTLMQNMIDVL